MSIKSRKACFLCQKPCDSQCPYCQSVWFCSDIHFQLHRLEDQSYCCPYEVDVKAGIGRILRATRAIKAMEIVLIDPGTVVGPNYSSTPVCLDCLSSVDGSFLCPCCRFPLCSTDCSTGSMHQDECLILGRCLDRPEALQIKGPEHETNAYSIITPLRTLLLKESGTDAWQRTDELMDHHQERRQNLEEWTWYQKNVVDFIRHNLGLTQFSEVDVHRAIGILNVNAVTLQYPRKSGGGANPKDVKKGKGIYPIFAIMSHYCICNARYTIDPKTSEMYVRARRPIMRGEELSVQYLSALSGTFKRRKKIRSEWHFDCLCRRCSDPSECATNISAVNCFSCENGYLLPANPLDYESSWICQKCGHAVSSSKIEELVDSIQSELDDIGGSDEFHRYEDFIASYQGIMLHPNHYLLMTATRNLIQFYTYSAGNEVLAYETLKRKLQLCQNFWMVLTRVDPGYSEIRNFVQKELNFCKLLLSQQDYHSGKIGKEEYLLNSRQSLLALDEVERNKKLIEKNIS
ncbi:hypothetical protein TCAL_03700 [Tigriopus californicus]|uniref:SET domain-containing protein n=1 Tax=Tigriopus californicus TaxID=6832 RepID=A0A553N9Q8_TIGCA|nr:SET domain-containing protein SmydA-8-like [Tigriopus californicus]TRY62157.1 hypothetical protein TCAL_03700 [Tigriopus californicus]|eukprot:TCALIF_03700-PA protein Name:"Similar to msta Protein msta, isoform A (Drosophila melanogaster)" AED:0.00 eAED:0.00 QI:0/-1/0/1/-1/1/1/0/516